MDLDQLRFLTDAQKDQYMRFERLFDAEGWNDIEKWAQANGEEAIQRQLNATTWDQTLVARGMLVVFKMVRDLRETTQREYAHMAEENQLVAQAQAEEDNE